jgi:hypothetical protein
VFVCKLTAKDRQRSLKTFSAGSPLGDPAEKQKCLRWLSLQAALRRAGAFRRAERAGARLRRALPARLVAVRFNFALRAGLALRLLLLIFAMGLSLSFSLRCNVCPISNRYY